MEIGFNFFGSRRRLKALIIHSNNDVEIKNVATTKTTFSLDDMSYLIDDRAIYKLKGQPMLFYKANSASPLRFDGKSISSSMTSEEINTVIETRLVRELLSSQGTGFDITMILIIVNVVVTAAILLNDLGVINLG